MSRYDDDQVIALLRDAVPPVPDTVDRVAAIRSRAGRQRAVLWTQTLGAVASVLLVVGVAAAVSTPGGDEVQPTSEPIAALAEALTRERSVRFEGTMKALDADGDDGVDSDVTGAATSDGDVQLDGDLAIAALLGGETGSEDTHVRLVDGVSYVSIPAGEAVPVGKKWLRTGGAPEGGVAELARMLRMVGALATDVRHTGSSTVRGERVAEYRLTIPGKWAGGKAVTVRFALDAQDRLRRVTSEFELDRVLNGSGDPGAYAAGPTAMVHPPDGGHEVVATARPVSPGSGPHTAGPGMTEPGTGAPPIPTVTPTPVATYDFDVETPTSRVPVNVRVELLFYGYGDDVRITPPPAAEVISEDALNEIADPVSAEIDACFERATTPDEAARCERMLGESGEDCFTTKHPDGTTTTDCQTSDGRVGTGSVSGSIGISPAPEGPPTAATASPTASPTASAAP